MDRQELLGKLKTLQPALAAHGLIPALTHIWFNSETITTYNDRIGISMPFKSGVKGLIPGAMLLGLLSNSGAKDVLLSPKDGCVVLKMGKANAELATLPYDDSMFQMPEPKGKKFVIAADTLCSAFSRCLRSTTDDTSVPDQLGVTLVQEDDGVYMYSTNGQVITRVAVDAEFKGRVVLPSEFCEQAIVLAKGGDEKVTIYIAENHALLPTKSATLYGRLIDPENPLPFQQQFEAHFPPKIRKKLVPIPGLMRTVIERSLVMAAAGDGAASVRVTISDGKSMKLLTHAYKNKSSIGKITDSLTLEKDHSDVAAELNPKALKAGLDTYTRMLIQADCVVMADDSSGVFLIATEAK